MYLGLEENGFAVIPPLDIKLEIPDNLEVHYPNLSFHGVEDLKVELSREHERFLAISRDVDLIKFWNLP